MNLHIILILIIFAVEAKSSSSVSQVSAADLLLSSQIHKSDSVEFLSFNEPTQWGSWLQQNLPYAPAQKLAAQLETSYQVKLKTRGEAHITVITPVEYWNVLKPAGLTMQEIIQAALKLKIQNAKFEVVCLGRGTAQLDNKPEQTYFVVVRSEDLVNIRKEIHRLFILKGGDRTKFDPLRYYPHITLGFTKRDLHESDGIIKGANSCIQGVRLIN